MTGYVFAFLAGALLTSSAMLAAASCGEAQRRGRRVVVRSPFGRRLDLGASAWAYAALFVFWTLFLPIGLVHDALFRRQWIEWEGPR